MFGRLDELKGRVKELEQQLQETSQEVRVWAAPKWALGSGGGWSGRADTAVSPQAEMERALLQGTGSCTASASTSPTECSGT